MHQKQFQSIKAGSAVFGRYALAAVLAVLLSACAGGQVRTEEPGLMLGLKTQGITPLLARDLGIPESRKGAIVVAVYQGSQAQTAGIRAGDLILGVEKANGTILETPDDETFINAIKEIPAQQPVKFSVFREGQVISISSARSQLAFTGYAQEPARPEPRTIKVAQDGTGDCLTLSGAQIVARPGDTIVLSPLPSNGIYGPFEVFLNEVTFRSEDIKNAAAFRAIHLTGVKGVKLVNLVFAGLETPESGWPGVYIEKCEGVEVSDNFIFGYPRAMSVLSSARVVISGNRMERNSSGINLSASDFKISGNLIAGQPMLKTISRGIFVSGGGGEIVNNTIVYHKVEKNTFIGNMSANFGPDGSGISAVNGARVSLENNIVFENSAGIFLGPDCQGRVEFNDIFQNTMPTGGTGPVGIFGSTSFESYLTGSDWNISKGVQHRYEEAPLLSLSSWHHHYWGPSPIQLSQTNLMQDPFFNDPVRGDYRLAPDSPLIGRGRGGVHIGAYPPVAGGAGEGAFK